MAQGDKPVKEFRAGSVRASIWRDEAVGDNDETFRVFSVRVERRYKDAEGNWQSTSRFKRSGPGRPRARGVQGQGVHFTERAGPG